MAEKRMFTQKIIDSDAFLEMPTSAQALYFHLNMRADDDGFVNNPKKITRCVGAAEDDLKLLIVKRFIIAFDSGVIVIKHWRMHNTLKMDRYHPTDYQEEFQMLQLKDKGKVYTERNQNGTTLEPENRLDKNRLDKIRLEESSTISNEMVCATDVARVIEAWNSLNLTRIVKITPDSQRAQWLNKRLRDYGLDNILLAIENVRNSSFLMGNNRKGWQATFDWFIKPNNFPKVLDGNYADSKTIDTNNIFLKILESEA